MSEDADVARRTTDDSHAPRPSIPMLAVRREIAGATNPVPDGR
jgi:hypothetical protein